MNPDYKKAMDVRREYDLNKTDKKMRSLREFLHRFINAANSHVELEPFVTEGEELLRQTDYNEDAPPAE